MSHSSRNPLLSVKWPTASPKNSMHAQTTVKTWMTENQLKLSERRQNRSSSLFLFVCLETFYRFPPWFDYFWLSQHPLLWFCQEPWIHFWLKAGMKKHVIKICQTAYFELKRISSIRRFLTEDATKTLVTSNILSRLDYSVQLSPHGFT